MQVKSRLAAPSSSTVCLVRCRSISEWSIYEPVLANHDDRVSVEPSGLCRSGHLLWPYADSCCVPAARGGEGAAQSSCNRLITCLGSHGFLSYCVQWYRPGHRNKDLQYIHLPLLGVLSAAGGLAVVGLSKGTQTVVSSIVPAMVSTILAAVILGTLLLHEKRHSETESELRESEARLAGQAKELAAARDTAEGANRTKSMFLANMTMN